MSLPLKYAFRACEHYPDLLTDQTKVAGPCYSCAKPLSVDVHTPDLDRFRAGEFASRCFSYLSDNEREFLISGICEACWDELFPEQEDDS